MFSRLRAASQQVDRIIREEIDLPRARAAFEHDAFEVLAGTELPPERRRDLWTEVQQGHEWGQR